jgi:predicted AlkP superfamily pyrophosphatase or phosphodiesterase
MCRQLMSLDAALEHLFRALDARGVDYLVALSADHGGLDIPERSSTLGAPDLKRASRALSVASANAAIGRATGRTGNSLVGYGAGDMWIDADVPSRDRERVLAAAIDYYRAQSDVAVVLSAADIAAAPPPAGPPETWPLATRVRATTDPARSGDFYVVLKPRVVNIPDPKLGVLVATHGSPWDYDRRVPMLFWRKGMVGFEQPLSVASVDLLPTFAAMLGLSLAPGEVDGKCLFECE